jgi:hypothetical protein
MPVCPAERSGQPGEKRQGRDRVDRREERSKILADFDQERRHGVGDLRFSVLRTPDQARDKVGVIHISLIGTSYFGLFLITVFQLQETLECS